MNREIKFKIYLQHEETGRIVSQVFDYAEIFSGRVGEILSREYPRYYVVGKGQDTGRNDSQGTDIFEHDVVEWDGVKFAVVWMSIGWPLAISMDGCKVIGDIFNNPDLCK